MQRACRCQSFSLEIRRARNVGGDKQGSSVTSDVMVGSEGEPEQRTEVSTWMAENAPMRKIFQEWTSDVTVV